MLTILKARASIDILAHHVEIDEGVRAEVLVRTVRLRARRRQHVALDRTADGRIVLSIVAVAIILSKRRRGHCQGGGQA